MKTDQLNPEVKKRIEAIAKAMLELGIPQKAFDTYYLTYNECAAFNAAWKRTSKA